MESFFFWTRINPWFWWVVSFFFPFMLAMMLYTIACVLCYICIFNAVTCLHIKPILWCPQ